MPKSELDVLTEWLSRKLHYPGSKKAAEELAAMQKEEDEAKKAAKEKENK